MVGPTFSCLLARQFRDLKRGDRFWHELPPEGDSAYTAFTPGKKTTDSKQAFVCSQDHAYDASSLSTVEM